MRSPAAARCSPSAPTSRGAWRLAPAIGGFALICHHALESDPALVHRFVQIVVLDPPSDRAVEMLLRRGAGFTHWSWGEAELRFAEQMHELEYGLRASLVALYRSLTGNGGGLPVRSSSACFAATDRTAARHDWPAG